MEEILAAIKEKLERMEERDERMERKIDAFQNELSKINRENKQLKSENQQLKQRITTQEKRMEEIEREIRKRRIIIHGIKEQDEEKDIQVKEKVRTVLRDMEIKIVMEEEITEIRRIGNQQIGKVRPILLELRNWSKKMEILKATKKLQGTKIYMEEDYSKEIQGQRKELIKHRNTIRAKGHHAIIRYNRLIINGDTYTLEQLNAEENDSIRYPGAEKTPKEKTGGRTFSERSPDEEIQEQLLKITKTNNSTGTNPKNLNAKQ